jgi:hypothetical protein
VIIDYFAFIYMSFYISLPIAMKATILWLILKNQSMRWLTSKEGIDKLIRPSRDSSSEHWYSAVACLHWS